MNERMHKEKAIDKIVLEQGPRHQKWLQNIAEKLKTKFDEPKLFHPETQKELDSWVTENKESVLEILEQIYGQLKNLDSTRSPGHELSHLIDNLNSALRIFEEYGDFSEVEKLLEITFS